VLEHRLLEFEMIILILIWTLTMNLIWTWNKIEISFAQINDIVMPGLL